MNDNQYDETWLANAKAKYYDTAWMDEIKPIHPRNNLYRKMAWWILFLMIAGWIGYESASYLGMFAVTMQEGLR